MRPEPRHALILWLLLMLASTAVLGVQLRQGLTLETNVLALLPETERDPVIRRASVDYQDRLARQHLLLVGADTLPLAREAAEALAARLHGSGLFADLRLRMDEHSLQAIGHFYGPYRHGLLAEADRQDLRTGRPEAVLRRSLLQLYSPAAASTSAQLEHDPLLLFQRAMADRAAMPGRVRLQDGYLTVQDGERHYLLLQLQLPDSPFARDSQQRLLPVLDAAIDATRAQFPGSTVLDTGVLRYADAGLRSARQEIATIGAGSLAGIVLLFLLVFRSPLPLAAALLPLACGFAAALAACLLVFGRIHLMTLVFGTSLIGLSIDYSLHFFTDRLAAGPAWQARDTVGRIGPGMALGLLSSVTGFAALCLAPFPGMQQMALFCSVGLVAAFISVFGLLPRLVRHPAAGSATRPLALGGWLFALWQGRWLALALSLLALLALTAGGLARLHSDDDIRLLQARPAGLIADEQRLRTLTGQQAGHRFLLVEAADAERLLQRNEALLTELRAAVADGRLGGFDSLADWLPSQARQQENRALIASLADTPALAAYRQQLGLDDAVIQAWQHAHRSTWLTPEAWLADPASAPWRALWLGETGRGLASLVLLRGTADAAWLADLDSRPGVAVVDPTHDISTLLGRYREQASLLVLLAYGLVLGLLSLRYRPVLALRALAPAALAALTALGVIGWIGEPLNIFHLLALLLVLGFGIDYSLFVIEGRYHPRPTLLAIALSALTTLLSFGLLALSTTPAIHAFGITVLSGIAVAFLFAPLACPSSQRGLLPS